MLEFLRERGFDFNYAKYNLDNAYEQYWVEKGYGISKFCSICRMFNTSYYLLCDCNFT